MRKRSASLLAVGLGVTMLTASAQQYDKSAATDSSAQASPSSAPRIVPGATDASALASPATGGAHQLHATSFASGTTFHVRLSTAIDSGKLKNGQDLTGTLSAPARAKNGSALAVGTPVTLNVVATVPAGKIAAMGELSLTLVRVGKVDVVTETKTFRGKSGQRDLPDATPAVGTNAGMPAGTLLTFHTAGAALAATHAPSGKGATPGSVNGVSAGAQPTAAH